MTKALMVDIETLSSKSNACILSIGAVLFDPYEVDTPAALVENWGQFTLVDPDQPGSSIDPDTVLWWMRQSEEARNAVIGPLENLERPRPAPKPSLELALMHLTEMTKQATEVWSHPESFDLVILQNAYERCAIKPGWHYTDWRDTRTIFTRLSTEIANACWPSNPQKHHPLWDAAVQAVALQNALAHIKVLDK